jgi:hypothetical protein
MTASSKYSVLGSGIDPLKELLHDVLVRLEVLESKAGVLVPSLGSGSSGSGSGSGSGTNNSATTSAAIHRDVAGGGTTSSSSSDIISTTSFHSKSACVPFVCVCVCALCFVCV